MYPKSFEYYRAENIGNALSLLNSLKEAKIIAGGQSLVPMMKLRVASPPSLVDVSKLSELRYIREDVDENGKPLFRIGALTTHSDLEQSELITKKLNILSSTARNIGDVQIRERGTVGGSVCHADPSADYFPTLLVLDASVVAISHGERRRSIPLDKFVIGPFETSLKEGEMMEELVIRSYSGVGGAIKFARRKADFALVSAAAILDYDHKTRSVKDFRISVAPQQKSAIRLFNVEKEIKSKTSFENASEIERAIRSNLGRETFDFPSDLHGSSWYRREILDSIIGRLLENLFEQMEGA